MGGLGKPVAEQDQRTLALFGDVEPEAMGLEESVAWRSHGREMARIRWRRTYRNVARADHATPWLRRASHAGVRSLDQRVLDSKSNR